MSRDRIVDAALEMVDVQGGMTILELARRLGVSPSSLYHHVTGIEEVLVLTRDRLIGAIPLPAAQGPWAEEAATWASACHEAFGRHADFVRLLVTHRRRGSVIGLPDELGDALVAAGLDASRVDVVMRGLERHLVGAALVDPEADVERRTLTVLLSDLAA